MIRAHFSHRPYHTLHVGSGHISDGRLLIRAEVGLQAVQAFLDLSGGYWPVFIGCIDLTRSALASKPKLKLSRPEWKGPLGQGKGKILS